MAPKTRSSDTKTRTLEELPGTTITTKTGGGKRPAERPTKEQPAAKRTAGQSPQNSKKGSAHSPTTKLSEKKGRGKRKAADDDQSDAAEDENQPQQNTKSDDSRAIAASVDTGEDPQKKLKKNTKQAGLKSSGEVDKTEHKPAAKPGRQQGAASKKAATAHEEAAAHHGKSVKINRAPVLTLWVKKVAQREGYDEDTAFSFGKAVSGMLAQSKGRSIGMLEEKEKDPDNEARKAEAERVDVFGMRLKVVREDGKMLAADSNGKAVNPKQVAGYLKRAFGEDLSDAEAALEDLAAALPASDIGSHAYKLYEQFRPSVSGGKAGWGQKGELDLEFISSLADQHRQ